MIVELMLASCLSQQPLPPTPPAETVPPVATPAPPPTPSLPPTAAAPAVQPPPTADAAPRSRTPVPPRAARTARAAPAALMAPPGVPYGQHAPAAAPMRRGGGYIPMEPAMGGMPGGQGMADVAAIYGMGRRAIDPKEAELDRTAREAAGNMLREQDPAKKAQIKASLQAMVAEQFQIRQQRRADEVKRLEEEVKRLRDALEKRERTKDAIVARRIAELTGEDDLGF